MAILPSASALDESDDEGGVGRARFFSDIAGYTELSGSMPASKVLMTRDRQAYC